MNGHASDIVLWLIGGLIAMVEVLLGVIWRMHGKSDEEHRARMDEEIKGLRTRMHELGDRVGELVAKDYFDGQERRRK